MEPEEAAGRLLLQVAAHAQQQQHMHGEQVEGEQQGRALAGAEGHAQLPHRPRAAAAPRLQEGETERGRRCSFTGTAIATVNE